MNSNGLVTPDRTDRRVAVPPGDMNAVSSRQTQQMLGAYPFASATPSTHSKRSVLHAINCTLIFFRSRSPSKQLELNCNSSFIY